ncbi:MAG: single-stranded-DNA-specific exonuclease RecJ [Minisyncoccia bacterium]|jgi:single-stranded-DNA-specific exonuclease
MPAYAKRRTLTAHEKDALTGHSDLLAHLLFHRGLADKTSADRFLNPDYERDTYDPSLLKDADKAADRIIKAVKNNEKIAIYADYDADGIPGAAMFYDFFNRIGFKDFIIYIPHRHHEGFGLNEEAVASLSEQGAKLVITVDCGISDTVAVERANKLGIDVIITDHHEPPQGLPPAFAIVDHKQADCAYPDKDLCGTGVAFKLIQAILAKDRFGLKKGMEKWLLDLVGLATLSDMVPLTGENRVFAHYGLAVMRKSQRKGLKQLFSRLRMPQGYVTEDDITFMITPRINAASRMGVPMDAYDLLIADNDADAALRAERLDRVNDERKGVVASLVKEVKKTVRSRHGTDMPSVIVLGNPAWRPSLLGLAANSCVEEFHRPVFLWGRDGDSRFKGSCRSEGKTHVVELMRAVAPGVLTEFGGHRHSGGFTVNDEAVHYLEQRLNEGAKRLSSDSGEANGPAGGEDDMIDAELSLEDIDSRLYDDISRLAPFGIGNPKPVFLFKKVSPTSVRRFGKGSEHIELVFDKENGGKISAISFFGVTNDWAPALQAGKTLDLVASLEKSMFRNTPELRLRVVDVIKS